MLDRRSMGGGALADPRGALIEKLVWRLMLAVAVAVGVLVGPLHF
jgi:hypothetical protein